LSVACKSNVKTSVGPRTHSARKGAQLETARGSTAVKLADWLLRRFEIKTMTESAVLPAADPLVTPLVEPLTLKPFPELSPSKPSADGVPPALELGSRVGSFELRRLISKGPSTAVYLAQDTTLAVDVAIKEFRLARGAAQQAFAGSATGSPTHVRLEPAVERGLRAFVEEARMLARCNHPSLMSVRGLFESHGTAYRVMPLHTATALTELRASMPRPPDEPSVRAVLDHLLGALEALHANGQVHGALVVSNVLLLPDDRPLLLGPGSAAREDAFVQATRHAQQHPEAPAPVFADKVSAELKDLADLAEFCITGVQRPTGHVREAGDTVTAAIVRELGAVELRHYSPAFLSVLDAAASACSEDRPRNTAQFAEWLSSHEVRRLKQQSQAQPAALTQHDEPRSSKNEWANTVPPAFWIEPAAEVATPSPSLSPADRQYAQAQNSISASQIWADTVQVIDDNPPPTKRATVYPPLPLPQVRPNFEQRRWEARKWMAGLGALGVGLIAALVYVVGGSKDAALINDAGKARTDNTAAVVKSTSADEAKRIAAATLPSLPLARASERSKSTSATTATTAEAAPVPTDMPEIRLPVADPFNAASAASAVTSAVAASAPNSNAMAAATSATVAAAAVAPTALARAVVPAADAVKDKPASKRPSVVKTSKAAWANGPRAVCSARTGAAAGSCLKTQCRSRKWASHPQCARSAGAKSAA
jgi:serine/threonine protein kinase